MKPSRRFGAMAQSGAAFPRGAAVPDFANARDETIERKVVAS
jgi:hypothetical protein